jgi:hypothetical protein
MSTRKFLFLGFVNKKNLVKIITPQTFEPYTIVAVIVI